MIYGVDVSAYQPNFDFDACAREGFDFAFIKSTEGPLNYWASPNYHDQIGRARKAGLLVAAYHYMRGSDVAGQLANIRSMVDTDTPVILDVEDGAGSISSIRALNAALNEAGYRTPLIYIPQWYWRDHMGSPDLTGLPPNWRSWYPDNTVRRKEAAVSAVPQRIWDEVVGGISTLVMQVTSSLAVANYPNGKIDGNAFDGTRDELAALLGGEADDMQLTDRMENAWGGNPTLAEVFKFIDLRAAEASEGVSRIELTLKAQSDVLAAIAADANIDAERLQAIVDSSVDGGLARIQEGLVTMVRSAVHAELGTDNVEQANRIVAAIARQLAGTASVPPNGGL